MSEQTWNKEQIEEAFHKAYYKGENGMYYEPDLMMDYLTNPKPVFKVGEVVAKRLTDATMWEFFVWDDEFVINESYEYRRPSSEEVPALALAIKILEKYKSTGFMDIDLGLAKIKEMTG